MPEGETAIQQVGIVTDVDEEPISLAKRVVEGQDEVLLPMAEVVLRAAVVVVGAVDVVMETVEVANVSRR